MSEGLESTLQASARSLADDLLDSQPPPPKRQTLEGAIQSATPVALQSAASNVQQPMPKDPIQAILSQLMDSQRQQAEQMQLFQQNQNAAFMAAIAQLSQAITASGQPHAGPAPASPAATPGEVMSSEQPKGDVLQSIPPELDKIILSRTRSFKHAVFTLARARTYSSKLAEAEGVFNGDNTSYPKSQKQFRSPISFAELDLPLEAASSGDHLVTITIPAGSSRREAMRLVHRESAKHFNTVLLEAQSDRIASLEPLAAPEVLKNCVTEVLAEASKPQMAETFGLQRPVATSIGQGLGEARVEVIYGKIYAALNKKLVNDAAATQLSIEKEKEKVEQLAKVTPDVLLSNIVDSKINKKLLEAGIANDSDMQDHPAAVSASEFVSAVTNQGNGQSPPVGVGQKASSTLLQSRPKAKAKASPKRSSHRWAHLEEWGRNSWWDRHHKQGQQNKPGKFTASFNQRRRAPEAATRQLHNGKGRSSSSTGKGQGSKGTREEWNQVW